MSNSECVKRYSQTVKGYLRKKYRSLRQRCDGRLPSKAHLYGGLPYCSWEEFYQFSVNDQSFLFMWEAYAASGFQRMNCPSLDRINSSRGYVLGNVRYISLSDNSRRGRESPYTSYGRICSKCGNCHQRKHTYCRVCFAEYMRKRRSP